MDKIKIEVSIEEDCFCDKGIIFTSTGDSVYMCMECDGTGKLLVKKNISIKEFKEITGAR